LARQLGVEISVMRQWLNRNHRDELRKVARREGGTALFVGPRGVAAVRERWGNPSQPLAPAAEAVPERLAAALSREVEVPLAEEAPPSAPAREELEPAWPREAALALSAAEHRATAAETRVEALSVQVGELREEVKDSHRRVGELERATGQLAERVRAWRDWYARVAASSWWRRRRLPDAPEDVKPPLVQ
jgi:hypothetical protein